MSRIVDTIRRNDPGDRPVERRGGVRKGDPDLGVVSYFHLNDRETAERVIANLETLDVRHLRTAVSWCDWLREGGEEWYSWLLPELLERFEVLPCFLYTPPHLGLMPKTSSPPREPEMYGEFVEMVLDRYPGRFTHVELWNEPNNYIEWDWTVDPEWKIFAHMIGGAAERASKRGVKPVLGGMSPFDPNWLDLMFKRGALEHVDVIGVHGFPGTWEAVWDGWDTHIDRVQEVINRHGSSATVWVTECGFSTWAHEEFKQLTTMVELAEAPAERVYWYSAEDLAPERETLDGFHCDERAYHFGLFRRSGDPKLIARVWEGRGLEGVREMVRFGTAAGGPSPERRGALVTGGAGFVGTNLADRLASDGTPVTILDSLFRAGVEENIRWLKEKHGDLVRLEVADLRDTFAVRRAVADCDTVFHLASQVAVTTSLNDPIDDMQINLQGTITLLEEMRRLENPPSLLFTSTNKVYGKLDDIVLRETDGRYEPEDDALRAAGVSEERPLQFSSPYGCSKGAADQYVLDYAHSFGLRTCVFRMSCIYGPHQHGNEDQGWVAHFLINALRGEPITIFGDGKQVRDLLYVEDLVDAMLLAVDNDEVMSGRAFNMGGGAINAASLLEVIDMIEKLDGERPQLDFGPWRVADQRYYVTDASLFRRMTGWRPQVMLNEGIERLYDWLAARHARPQEAARSALSASR